MQVDIFSIFVNILDGIEDGALKESQRWLLVDSLWVCFSTLRPLRLCERNMREKYVWVVLSDTNVPLRGIKNISEYRRTGPTLCLEKSAHDKNKQNTCCDARAAPFVSSPVSACSEASFGKPAPKKKQPSFLRLASQQGKPWKQAGAVLCV